MGFFDLFPRKKAVPAAEIPVVEHNSCGPAIVEIARLISGGDEAVLRSVSACAEHPRAWFEAHRDQYEERSVQSSEDTDLIQWLGMVDILERDNYVCERDWKDEREDFLFFVQRLNGFQAQKLSIDPAWLDENGDICAWCSVLTEQWAPQGVRMASIDIGSDSYILFPVSTALLPTLKKLAAEIGQSIEFVEIM